MTDSLSILSVFRSTLLDFFLQLVKRFPSEKSDIMAARYFLENIPVTLIIGTFHYFLSRDNYRLVDVIDRHDDEFFIKNNIFDKVSKSKYFEGVWKAHKHDTIFVEKLWSWVDDLVRLYFMYCSSVLNETGASAVFEIPEHILH